MFPMLQTQRLYFQWSLFQQACTAFHSKTKWIPTPIRTRVYQYKQVLHSNQPLFASPMFLLLLPLEQFRIYTRVDTLSQPIQRNRHLPIQTSFQTQIYQHQDSTPLYYPSVLHHTPLWILCILLNTTHQSAQVLKDTVKVQHIQSLITLNRQHYRNCIHHHHHFQFNTK